LTNSFALALGGGGARGLAHVVVIEALDELGVRPVAIAGASIGAVVGAAYAAGLSGKEIRRFAIDLAHDRAAVMGRLMRSRAAPLKKLFGAGFGDATRLDGEKLCAQFLPETLLGDFGALKTPLAVVASDLYRRREVVLTEGSLKTALAASIALPTIVRPVVIGGQILVDGSATNPLPFDLLRGRADVTIAVDISGPPVEGRREVPSALECLYATVLVMAHSIASEKLKHSAPDLILQPRVGAFRTLDFFRANAILRAAEANKAEIKDKLARVLGLPR
jgi:NTE family protein